MKTAILLSALAASSFLCAQNDKTAPPAGAAQRPNPKTPQHEALATLAGKWETTTKMSAMPGVPGMEKAFESTGTEHAELICNGLWLKAVASGTCAEGKFEGIWLVGYDPFKNSYSCVFACNQDEPSCTADASYDASSKTWTFKGQSPKGPFRSVYVQKDADNSTETLYMTGTDGKEAQCMSIVRKRAKGASAKEATAKLEKPASKELGLLAEGVGTWDAVVKCTMSGMPPTEEKATEHIVPLCEGKWFWSDFKGNMMGAPFEGHGLTGYDPSQHKFVSYWIDSMSAVPMKTTGTYDETKKTFTFDGSCVDPEGKPMTVRQTCTHTPDTRKLQMTFKSPQQTNEMTIDYKRTSG